jgi:hypothetical protein
MEFDFDFVFLFRRRIQRHAGERSLARLPPQHPFASNPTRQGSGQLHHCQIQVYSSVSDVSHAVVFASRLAVATDTRGTEAQNA